MPQPRVDSDLLAVETRGICKSFGRQRILDGVDLQVPVGVIAAVAGPSGTGKSVLMQHVAGLLEPDAGEVFVLGRSLTGLPSSELMSLRTEIGVMFQDGALFSAMNVFDNVAFPLRQHTDLEDHEVHEVVFEHLRSVGLEGAANRMPRELSGGMRKRAGLARALVLDPQILIADEPDSGLDPVRTALLGDLLLQHHEEAGGTTIVVSHDPGLIKRIAGHISILWNGRILASGMTEDVMATDNEFVQQFMAGATVGPLGMDA